MMQSLTARKLIPGRRSQNSAMIDLSNYKDYLSDKAHRVLTSAIEESQKRQHYYLGVEHIFLAIMEVESGLFADLAGKLNVSPNKVVHSLEEYLSASKQIMGGGMKVPPSTKTIFKLAWDSAIHSGRKVIETTDLLKAIFQEGPQHSRAHLAGHGGGTQRRLPG